jgi:hypothetical protein
MTADRAKWVGTVTAPELLSPLEVQRRVAQAIGRATYSWPPSRMLPMLPNAGTKKFVICLSSRPVSLAFCRGKIFSDLTLVHSCRGSGSAPTSFRPRRLSRRKQSSTRTRLRQRRGALHVRRSIRSVRSPSAIKTTTTTRGKRRGRRASLPMRTRRPSRLGAVMSLARRLTGATCRGRPRHRHPEALNCHRRAGRERRSTTRLWAQAHVRRLLLHVWACGLPAPVQHPAEQALPSRRDPRPVRLKDQMATREGGVNRSR